MSELNDLLARFDPNREPDEEGWIDLYRDAAFCPIFTDHKSKPALTGLLNSMFDEAGMKRIVELEYLDPTQRKETLDDKETCLDLFVKDETGRRFVVEMQSYDQRAFLNRLAFYGARALSGQLDEGEGYEILRPVVCVAFIRGPIFKDLPNLWFDVGEIRFRRSEKILEIVTFVLVRVPRDGELPIGLETEAARNWAIVLGYFSQLNKEERDALERETPGLKELRVSMSEFTETKREQIVKYSRDYQARLADAKSEGRDEGRKSLLASLCKVLYYRFNADPAESARRLDGKTLEELEALYDLVFACASYEEFCERA
ncbi:MAG: Rpn family recombination-promoting nuclease/putative transposase [Thermoguttaceae bacterium]|nr:Rpn family recombination-promoting nuclease/putative transposase [Thermoguttaceae bacterium]